MRSELRRLELGSYAAAASGRCCYIPATTKIWLLVSQEVYAAKGQRCSENDRAINIMVGSIEVPKYTNICERMRQNANPFSKTSWSNLLRWVHSTQICNQLYSYWFNANTFGTNVCLGVVPSKLTLKSLLSFEKDAYMSLSFLLTR